MEDLKRARNMERVLRDMRGEGNSVATLAKRYSLSEESINNVLGIRPEVPESRSVSKNVSFWKRLGF
jgi:Mor family transcriptional regulator